MIYLILDKADANNDRRLARHLLSMYQEGHKEDAGPILVRMRVRTVPPLRLATARGITDTYAASATSYATITAAPQDVEMLSAYISYAREKIFPKLDDDASRDLIDGYVGAERGGREREERGA